MAKKKPKASNGKVALYCYVEPKNAEFAQYYGRKKFGSYSEYVDKLIADDRNKRHVVVPVVE